MTEEPINGVVRVRRILSDGKVMLMELLDTSMPIFCKTCKEAAREASGGGTKDQMKWIERAAYTV